jgi:hypothetical protein
MPASSMHKLEGACSKGVRSCKGYMKWAQVMAALHLPMQRDDTSSITMNMCIATKAAALETICVMP